MNKSSSFSSRNSTNVGTEKQLEGEKDYEAAGDLPPPLSLPQVLADVDHFLNINSTTPPPGPSAREVPDCVLILAKLLEDCMMDKYNTNRQGRSRFGQDPKEDKSFLDIVDRISQLSTILPSSAFLDKTSSVLEKAISILENDLCALLQDPKHDFHSKTSSSRPAAHKKSSSFSSLQLLFQLQNESESAASMPNPYGYHIHADERNVNEDEDLPTFSIENISVLNKISTAMISAGYQTECCMAFVNFRRNSFKTALHKFGYAGVRMEDVYRMQWESLEGEIAMWNKVVRHCTTAFFNTERRLYESVFPNQPSISQSLFGELAWAVIIHFLNFAQAVVLTKPSPEKLFKMLDMYETLRNNVERVIIDDSYSERCAKELAYETAATKDRIVEAVVAMFCDLESSIKSDNERIPVPYGAVHPMTRYVMNYLKYACEYKDTLEQVFRKWLTGLNDDHKGTWIQKAENHVEVQVEDGTPKESPFAIQLMTIMDLLDANIERKSKLYRDPALRYIFLMNNGRYIVQKIKGCAELHESMGDNWCRRRQSGLRLYHKSYQRETWSKVLRCLNPEGGLQGSGNKVSKQVLKERFKSFNAMFEEIHKTQSSWMVSDEQLQSELRVSISALVIPAYRSFLGRFKHHLESGRHFDKYIKYHPEDIETLVDDFFGGNAMSMARRRT